MPFEAEVAALRDILRQIDLAFTFTNGHDAEAFEADTMRLYAAARCLEIISEASERLSDALKSRHPEIPWLEMAFAGSVYRHDDEDVAPRRIWDTVAIALPPLQTVVEAELTAMC
ncbi:MAG: DUF86 domain-containing protein [Alphaproteobacteria bacterium]|jgi:uncharacterized protein with HEPN domain|nr:DUF86 domain-containing protein [Alphaproteobacteria bacterium]